jgi:hypothetical protein
MSLPGTGPLEATSGTVSPGPIKPGRRGPGNVSRHGTGTWVYGTVFFAASPGRDGGHTVNDDAPEPLDWVAEWADYQG